MKRIFPYIFAFLSCGFVSKTVKIAIPIFACIESRAQFSFYYTPADSVWHNQGGWSLLDLYRQKDSTVNTYSSFWRFTTRIVEARNLSAEFPNQRHDTLVVARPDGRLFKMKSSDVPLTVSQVTTALTYVPLQVEIDGSITNEIQMLSGSGTNTINLSMGGGVFAIPVQTVGIVSNITPTLTALTGITIGAAGESYSVTNSLPDQVVSLTAANASITISGTYPNFTIGNASPNKTITLSGANTLTVSGTYPSFTVGSSLLADFTATAATSGSVATIFLTANGTSTGTALYSNVNYVNPVVNDVTGNYTFGWTVSSDKKTLTVSAKVATNTAVISLLGISLLSSTVPVSNGTVVSILVKGN